MTSWKRCGRSSGNGCSTSGVKGIRGADFFISAIGPALSVFGRHARVLRPDGSEVSVRDFLDIVRRESTAVALEQVMQVRTWARWTRSLAST